MLGEDTSVMADLSTGVFTARVKQGHVEVKSVSRHLISTYYVLGPVLSESLPQGASNQMEVILHASTHVLMSSPCVLYVSV